MSIIYIKKARILLLQTVDKVDEKRNFIYFVYVINA